MTTLRDLTERVARERNRPYCCEEDSGPPPCSEASRALEILQELLEFLQAAREGGG